MFRKLFSLEQAQRVIHEQLKPRPLGSEEISLQQTYGRVLAEDTVADIDVPPFDRSTVDGYAVKARDTFGANEKNPVELTLRGIVAIGELPRVKLEKKQAAEIATGAPIPRGADAVIMAEHTDKTDDQIRVFSSISKNGNIMKTGSDIRKGETVLRSGRLLGSREIGVLAALGIAKVKVFNVPRVAVFSTGPEVTEPGKDLSPGRIYDINAHSIGAAVLESGGKPIYLGVFQDRATDLRDALSKAINSADIVVTSGGVSVGPKDIMPKVLDSLGEPGLIMSGIAIKPGKPTTIGKVNSTPVFLLPGHPTSALLVFHLLVGPMIMAWARRRNVKRPKVKAIAARRMFSAKGRRTFIMVELIEDKSKNVVANPVSTGESGAITTLAKANGYVEIAENVQFVDAGEEVIVRLFKRGGCT